MVISTCLLLAMLTASASSLPYGEELFIAGLPTETREKLKDPLQQKRFTESKSHFVRSLIDGLTKHEKANEFASIANALTALKPYATTLVHHICSGQRIIN